jgi:predicted Holliday junction resolvase-like endonuclease
MTALLVLFCVALFVALVVCLLSLLRLQAALSDRVDEQVDLAIKDFKKRSGRTRVGTTVEQMVPFVKDMPFDPSDMRILSGGPVDYVVFDGLCDGEVQELVFLDIKTGKGKVNSVQRQVKRCADLGLVSFGVFEVDERGKVRYRSSDRVERVVDLAHDEADPPPLGIVID